MSCVPLTLAATLLASLFMSAGCERDQVAQTSYTTTDSPRRADNVVNDNVIVTQVKTALLADPELNGRDISVSAEGGRVTLSGQVPRGQIARAEAVTRGIDGVVEVANQLVATDAPR